MLFPTIAMLNRSKLNFLPQLSRNMVMVAVLLTSFVLGMRETGMFQMLLTLAVGPGGGHTLVQGPRRAIPVGSGDAEPRLEDILITISQ